MLFVFTTKALRTRRGKAALWVRRVCREGWKTEKSQRVSLPSRLCAFPVNPLSAQRKTFVFLRVLRGFVVYILGVRLRTYCAAVYVSDSIYKTNGLEHDCPSPFTQVAVLIWSHRIH
jgi:hypothetical protein